MNAQLLAEAAASLDVLQINLGTHSVVLADDFTSLIELPPAFINLQWGPKRANLKEMDRVGGEGSDTLWLVWFRTVARYYEGHAADASRTDGTQPPLIATLEADWLMQYRQKVGRSLSEDALQEFANYNVPVHVWPYWREWLQATCSRVGLPVHTLQMMLPKSIHAHTTTDKTSDGETTD